MTARLNLPDAVICEEYKNGVSSLELSRIYNCDKSVILDRLHQNGVEMRRPGLVKGKNVGDKCYQWRDVPVADICLDYLYGHSVRELSDKYGVAQIVISSRLDENGIKLRPLKEQCNKYQTRRRYSIGRRGINEEDFDDFIYIDRGHVLDERLCVKLNDRFIGSHCHHLTRSIVCYIPAELHRHIGHRLNDGYNMGEMNMLALQFINGGYDG